MTLTADDLSDLVALILEKRLGELAQALLTCRDQVEAEMAARRLTPGPMSRGQLVSTWIASYEHHCQQVLGDLIGLVRSFAATAAAEQLPVLLDQHLDAAAAGLGKSLAESGFGGLSFTSSEQKRITNVVAGVKRQARQRWQEEIGRVAREQHRAGTLRTAAEDLDDRLPLNRRGAFDRDLAALVKEAGGNGECLALVMIDIDLFKRVNDSHGHPVGDEVLLEVAELVVRRVAHKGKSYRYGGEELAVLLPTYSGEEAAGLAERLRKDLASTTMSSKALTITASFGVAALAPDGGSPRELLEAADGALYRAKHGGRNQVCSATGEGEPPGL